MELELVTDKMQGPKWNPDESRHPAGQPGEAHRVKQFFDGPRVRVDYAVHIREPVLPGQVGVHQDATRLPDDPGVCGQVTDGFARHFHALCVVHAFLVYLHHLIDDNFGI